MGVEDKDLENFIKAELKGNLSVLIDPKKKDSFSNNRVQTWANLVSERIVFHMKNHIPNTKKNVKKKI